MKDISNTSERIQFALKQMEKTMPTVKIQVAIYERNIKLGKDHKKGNRQ
jgi:hypothetical protein